MKQTVILYGDPTGDRVLITNCVTEQFSQEAVYDPSNTDLMYHRFTVVVVGFVTGSEKLFRLESNGTPKSPLNSFSGGVNGGLTGVPYGQDANGNQVTVTADPAKQHVSFRSLLLEPRKNFEMRVGCRFDQANPDIPSGGTRLLKAEPHPYRDDVLNRRMSPSNPVGFDNSNTTSVDAGDFGGYDLNNGPRCTRCEILQIVGNQLFRVRVAFEICKLECSDHGQAPNNNDGVISNRWSVVDDINENFLTTRRFQGLLKVSTTQLNAHEFRSWVVPPLQAGFYRRSMNFRVSDTGLELAYEIVDQETVWSAPGNATKWFVAHTETNHTDAIQVADIVCQLWGDRKTSLSELLKIAIAVVHAKANPVIGLNKGAFPELILHTEAGTDNHSVRVQWRVTRGVVGPNMKGVAINALVRPISDNHPEIVAIPDLATYDASLSRGARPSDSVELSGPLSIASAWRAYLQSPCDEDHEIALTADATPENVTAPATAVSVVIVPADVIAVADQEWVNSKHADEPYMVWEMTSRYSSESNLVMLGVANSVEAYISGDAPTAAFARLGPTTTKRIVEMTGSRIGKEPLMPAVPDAYSYGGSSSGNRSARLLSKSIVSQPPERASDGTQVFKVAAALVYGLTHPPTNDEKMLVGFNPWEYPEKNYSLPPARDVFNGPSLGSAS